jgi:hypothetical protein
VYLFSYVDRSLKMGQLPIGEIPKMSTKKNTRIGMSGTALPCAKEK